MSEWCPQEMEPILSTLGSVQWQIHSADPMSWLDKFTLPLIATFVGAIGGSLTILIIEWWRQQRRLLADINASIGVYGSLINTILNLKAQFIQILVLKYDDDFKKFSQLQQMKALNPNPPQPVIVKFSPFLQRCPCPLLAIDAPLERIFAQADKEAKIVPMLMQTKVTLKELENTLDAWNKMILDMQNMPEDDRGRFYFGQQRSNGVADTYFPDMVKCLSVYTDDALFFVNRSVHNLMALGRKTLPFWLKKKVCKAVVIDEKYKPLMPSEDHLEGWYAD